MKLGISSRAELIRDAPEVQPSVATNDQRMVTPDLDRKPSRCGAEDFEGAALAR
jgi:hypothetical protein